MNIIREVKKEEQLLIAYRRHLHEHPELSGVEFETLRFIRERLTEFGIHFVEVENGGILATIDSQKAGKTVMLRADIDALPIQESLYNAKNIRKPTVSSIPNVQHACGHDAHTAILLVAGKILNEHKDAFIGKVVLCFERGEEVNGNIFYLLKYFDKHNMRFDSCFGLHVGSFSEGKTGAIVVKSGEFMAGMTSFNVTLKGAGGHGSRPDLANNPIDCFCAIYNGIGQLRMRKIAPSKPLTYSIGYLSAGSKSNIIPETLAFAGTIRYFDIKEAGDPYWKAIKKIIDETAKLYDCKVTYDEIMKPGYPVVNNPDCTEVGRIAFSKLFNDVTTSEAQLGTESFSFFMQKTPGLFVHLCTNNEEKGITAGVHTDQFDLDETVLYKGVCCHIAYALEFLNHDYSVQFAPNAMTIDEIIKDSGRCLY